MASSIASLVLRESDRAGSSSRLGGKHATIRRSVSNHGLAGPSGPANPSAFLRLCFFRMCNYLYGVRRTATPAGHMGPRLPCTGVCMNRRFAIAAAAAVTCAAGFVAGPAGLAGAATATPSVKTVSHTVVVSGLNNPRQLSWGPHGSLLVAEAGRGSLHPSSTNCFTGPEGQTCAGATGSISLVPFPRWQHNSKPLRVVTGLLSGGAPDGGHSTGSDGVSYGNGRLLIQETALPPIAGLPNWQSGQLLSIRPGSKLRSVADISAVERNHNPDGLQVDTDPYAVLSLGQHRSVSTDAAGNDLVVVDRHGAKATTVLRRTTTLKMGPARRPEKIR